MPENKMTEGEKRERLAEFMRDTDNGVVFCQDANGFMGRDGLHIIDVRAAVRAARGYGR